MFMRTTEEKILKDKNKLKNIIQQEKDSGRKIVFTNGCFDLLHVGHIRLLKEAKAHGDILVVGLNTDKSLLDLKGNSRGILNEEERGVVIAALESVDYVCFFDEPTPKEIIELVSPDVLIKGGDYKIDEIVGRDTVWENKGVVKAIPLIDGYSTTNLINRIINIHK